LFRPDSATQIETLRELSFHGFCSRLKKKKEMEADDAEKIASMAKVFGAGPVN
jgi:hypothetical protein